MNAGGRAALTGALASVLASGCLDELLESPYVLATGLGEVRSLSPGTDGRLLAATSTGLYAIDTEGKTERIGEAARAVTAFPDRTYTLDDRVIGWRSTEGQSGGIVTSAGRPGDDILAGDGELVVLEAGGLSTWPSTEHAPPRTIPLPAPRTVALGPGGSYLVVTADALHQVDGDAVTTLAAGLTDARAAATDAKGRVYVAQGDPTELWRVDRAEDGTTTLVSIAKWLGDVRDMHFGVGPFPAENLYIANGAGTVDYVRPP